MHIRLTYSGRNYDQAATLPEEIELPDDATLGRALDALRAAMRAAAPPAKELPDTCLVVLAGVHLGTVRSHQDRPLHDGDELLLITPVAGG